MAEEEEQSAPIGRRAVGGQNGGNHQVYFRQRKAVAVHSIAAVAKM